MGVRRDVAANFLGKVWTGFMNFLFVPVYLKFLTIEAYGLIGFFTSLTALTLLFDLGLSTTLNRELARLGALRAEPQAARNLVRSMECVYWSAGAVLGAAIVLAAPWLARHWLNSRVLSPAEVSRAIALMGVVIFLRWPATLYVGGLMGLDRQVLANGAAIAMATVQNVGAALILWLVSPTIGAFFGWQIAASLAQILILPWLLWRAIPGAPARPVFSLHALRQVWRFAAGMSGITMLSVVLMQADKFLLSKLMPLASFGYYSLASSIAGVLNLAAMAVYAAMFPNFSRLVSEGRSAELTQLYHRACQFLSILLLPAAASLVFFSRELLSCYVHDGRIVENTQQVLSLLAVGNLLLSIMLLPLALQLAFGWTRLSFYKNVLAVILFVPMMIFMIERRGIAGAAMTWIMLTAGYFLIEIPIMHRRLLRGELSSWYLKDIGVPLLLSVGCIGTAKWLVGPGDDARVALPVLIAAAGTACAGSALMLRRWGNLG